MAEPGQPAFRVVQIDDQHGGGGDTPRTGRFARSDVPKAEVRRCGRCDKDAVICCQAWNHSLNGISTGAVTRECRCQACGADITLRDPKAVRNMKIVGLIMIITIVGAPILLIMAWRWGRAWDKNPLVPGAPRPKILYWRGPGNRRCGGCGKVARLVGVTRHSHNGIPTGTDCQYSCPSCKREFVTESIGGHLFSLFTAAIFAGGGTVALFEMKGERATWQLALSVAAILGGLWMLLRALRRVLAAISNPKLQGEEAAA